MSEKVIVMGSGVAGLTAAIYAARADLNPLVFEGGQPGGQLTTTTLVENFPGFADGIDAFELMDAMKRQALRFGARCEYTAVTDVCFDRRPIEMTTADGKQYLTDSLIIATGATARYLGLEAERKLRGKGVSACAVCDGAFFRDVPVCVVGGGDSAMEEACYLTRFASKVYVIHRRDKLRASKTMADRVMANPKIEIVWDTVVEDIADVAQDKVTAVDLRNVKTGEKRTLEVSAYFSAIGHQPNTALFRDKLDMDDAGYLLTENTRTRELGVFAAGDVQDPVYRQAITAAGSGCQAALEAERYLGSLLE